MDIIERIEKIIEHEGLSVSAFARKVGVGDQTIRGIVVQHRNKPGFDLINKIVRACDWLNVEWLVTGEGEMEKEKTSWGGVEIIVYQMITVMMFSHGFAKRMRRSND